MKKIMQIGIVLAIAAVIAIMYPATANPEYEISDFLTLIENTDQCLVDCYAIIELKNPTESSFMLNEDTWSVWYDKAPGARHRRGP